MLAVAFPGTNRSTFVRALDIVEGLVECSISPYQYKFMRIRHQYLPLWSRIHHIKASNIDHHKVDLT